ncbi:MAG: hypothetical protein ACRED9_14015 [Caulobacteraceae bacterium]
MVESGDMHARTSALRDDAADGSPRLGLEALTTKRALFLAAAFVTALVWLSLCLHMDRINGILGDTDDAMRLVLVRALYHGRGWWDQLVTRLQPPFGSYMQWSRLLTGAEAVALWIANLLAPAGRGEWAMRFFWPLALIPVGVVFALAAARRLGGPAALVPAALLLLLDPNLYVQFIPGRLDHHNLQIALAVASFACAIARRDREKWAAASGVFSGLGLAIGLEALFFHALIGVFFALRLVADPREAKTARAYGVGLATSTLVFFCVQTPPWRWGLSFCDALALNTVVAVIAAGGGLALVAWAAQRKGARLGVLARGASIVVVGVLAGGAFLALDPSCLRGPFEAVDPRVRGFWFNHILEIQPWQRSISSDRDRTLGEMIMAGLAFFSALFLVLRRPRSPDPRALLAFALVLAAIAANAEARRMQSYVGWFGAVTLPAALAAIRGPRAFSSRRGLRPILGVVPAVIAALILSPVEVSALAIRAANSVAGKKPGGVSVAAVSCFDTANFSLLARLPPGLVLSETDLGSFILADTRDSVLAAPYHRMSWGILAAHDVLDAPSQAAQAMTRRLKVDYIVDCPDYPMNVRADSFGDALRARTPPWLQILSPPRAKVRVYRVLPPSA